MKIVADLHLHSKYSRATSKQMEIPVMTQWAKWKGINLLATGDWTHPLWISELKRELDDCGNGFYRYKEEGDISKNPIYFILSTEISCIYSQNGKGRRIHLVVLTPSLKSAEKINEELKKVGNLYSDGRPILGISAENLSEMILNAEPHSLIIPAHIWTPWFSMFGSASGFNSVEECFGKMSPYVYAIETGLSSDPPMNWRVSNLDEMSIISCSDAHSPANLMREACVIEMPQPSYDNLTMALKIKNQKSKIKMTRPPSQAEGVAGAANQNAKILYTIEFYPEEGKYHYDGHRQCGVRLSPTETKKYQGLCPNCGRPVTVGVMNRVDELADRQPGEKGENARPYKSLVSLTQIIGESLGIGENSKAVRGKYQEMVSILKNELYILSEAPEKELLNRANAKIVNGIMRSRRGNIQIEPGYDGEYGKVKVFAENTKKQASLFSI